MRSYLTILRRELWCAFTAPQAWTLLAAYLLVSGLLTLTLGGFLEQNSADLNGFFVWQPWLFLFLGSAFGMGAWSDEYRSGALEVLLSHPVGFSALVAAKLTAGCLLCLLALLLTAPIPLACAWLGNPDWGPIAAGYLGCLLTAAFFVAFSQAASALFKSPFVSFAAAILPGLALMLIGFQPFNLLMLKWRLPGAAIAAAAQAGINSHFTYFQQGLVRLGDILWFASLVWLLGAATAWKLRRRHGGRRQGHALRLLPPLALLVLSHFIHGSLDFTADRLWTLDAGSRESIHAIAEPVTTTPRMAPPKRTVAAAASGVRP